MGRVVVCRILRDLPKRPRPGWRAVVEGGRLPSARFVHQIGGNAADRALKEEAVELARGAQLDGVAALVGRRLRLPRVSPACLWADRACVRTAGREVATAGGERVSPHYPPTAAASVDHHGADDFPACIRSKALLMSSSGRRVGDHRVDLDLAVHVPVDDLRHVGAARGAAERGALPDAAGDQLERPGGDLLAGLGARR